VIDDVLTISGVQKNYSTLRPLRIQSLNVGAQERVALGGFDAAASEVLVNLITGAALPDTGSVRVFGRKTSEISDGDEWLASLERFGIMSPRAVILEGATLQQNLALPFTLEIDPIPPSVIAQVSALAMECGIDPESLSHQAGTLPPHIRVRAHLARAVALNPKLLLIEHPTADLADDRRLPLARDIASVVDTRGAAALVMTMDVEFAEAVAHRSLALQPATGALAPWKKKREWFR
jgi:ABC-type transporter Mla maintaining outer membrane lipid asymmetry ATPase subunit MlaF